MSTTSVICVSRSLASRGEEIAHTVAERLDFRYIDDEVLKIASVRAGVSPETIARVEHMRPVVERVAEELATVRHQHEFAHEIIHDDFNPETLTLPHSPTELYQSLIPQVIRETAAKGDVVIVERGASLLLAGTDGLLRVLITASPSVCRSITKR